MPGLRASRCATMADVRSARSSRCRRQSTPRRGDNCSATSWWNKHGVSRADRSVDGTSIEQHRDGISGVLTSVDRLCLGSAPPLPKGSRYDSCGRSRSSSRPVSIFRSAPDRRSPHSGRTCVQRRLCTRMLMSGMYCAVSKFGEEGVNRLPPQHRHRNTDKFPPRQ